MDFLAFFSLFASTSGLLKLGGLTFAVSFLCAFLLAQPARFRFLRAAEEHWTERARLLYPLGRLLRVQQIYSLVPAATLGIGRALYLQQASLISDAIFLGLCAVVGCHLNQYFCINKVFPHLSSPQTWLWQYLFRYLPLATHLFLYFGMTWVLSSWLALDAWLSMAITWVTVYSLITFGGWFLPYRLFRLTTRPSERLVKLVDSTVAKMGVRPPKELVILRSTVPYAAAMPTINTLIYSVGILGLLSDEELSSITAHEMVHLQESRAQLALRYLPGLFLIPLLLLLLWYFSEAYFVAIALYLVILNCFGRYARRLAKKLERQADSGATKHEEDSGTYARALEKLYEYNLVPASIPVRAQTHPDLYDRLISAGVTPSYPRPALPPTRELRLGIGGYLSLIFVAAALLVSSIPAHIRNAVWIYYFGVS